MNKSELKRIAIQDGSKERIAELERELVDVSGQRDSCVLVYEEQLSRLRDNLAELERKLAEYQALNDKYLEYISIAADTIANNSTLASSKAISELMSNYTNALYSERRIPEELNTIIAKAKEEGRMEAIPEGCVVVQNAPLQALQYQTQVDEDGVLIGVSRQAVDELLASAPKP